MDKTEPSERNNESAPARLARCTVELFARKRGIYEPDFPLPSEFKSRRAGVFVTIHRESGSLRGYMGTIFPTQKNITEEIIYNAVIASTEDPRFRRVSSSELAGLNYSVDVLGESELIQDESELDPQKYGVIVSSGERHGLLLPRLEGINTIDEQIIAAMRKAGIFESERPRLKLKRFIVTRYQ